MFFTALWRHHFKINIFRPWHGRLTFVNNLKTTCDRRPTFNSNPKTTCDKWHIQDSYLLVFYAFLLQKNMHYLKTFLKLTVGSIVDNDSKICLKFCHQFVLFIGNISSSNEFYLYFSLCAFSRMAFRGRYD